MQNDKQVWQIYAKYKKLACKISHMQNEWAGKTRGNLPILLAMPLWRHHKTKHPQMQKSNKQNIIHMLARQTTQPRHQRARSRFSFNKSLYIAIWTCLCSGPHPKSNPAANQSNCFPCDKAVRTRCGGGWQPCNLQYTVSAWFALNRKEAWKSWNMKSQVQLTITLSSTSCCYAHANRNESTCTVHAKHTCKSQNKHHNDNWNISGTRPHMHVLDTANDHCRPAMLVHLKIVLVPVGPLDKISSFLPFNMNFITLWEAYGIQIHDTGSTK